MSTAMTTTANESDTKIEALIANGDLSKLSAGERVTYYRRLCDAVGVSPWSRPFEYLMLNGKLVLYARKDCTDQLRTKRQISLQVISKERVDDMFVVVARARTADGREDEDMGAVDVKGLSGERLANAMMKCITKAKRRVTLSICGLGLTDESEIDSIPNARPIHIDLQTGELEDPMATESTVRLPDFESLLDGAATLDELRAVAKDINEASKAGKLQPDVRKALGERYKARSAELNGAAA